MSTPTGTLEIWSDIGCPWAHCSVHRLHAARHRLGLDERVVFEHRAFPLEIVNDRPTPKPVLDAEIPVVGALVPEAGWQLWSEPSSTWPVTMLPALEAVRAARRQGPRPAEQLDRALRVAFFAHSRCISMRHEILTVAEDCDDVDVDALRDALDEGLARAVVFDELADARRRGVRGSPHVFAPGGTSLHNPGVQMHWHGEHGRGFPLIDGDDPSVYERLVRMAAQLADVA